MEVLKCYAKDFGFSLGGKGESVMSSVISKKICSQNRAHDELGRGRGFVTNNGITV